MKLFRQLRTISVEVIYLTVAVVIGIAVLVALTKTSAYAQLEASQVGAPLRWGRALLYQTANP